MIFLLVICAAFVIGFFLFRKKRKNVPGNGARMFDFSRMPNSGFNKKKKD
jgi:hypothetical protein